MSDTSIAGELFSVREADFGHMYLQNDYHGAMQASIPSSGFITPMSIVCCSCGLPATPAFGSQKATPTRMAL